MKLKIDREQFLNKIKSCYKFVSDKAIIPALLNFKITVKDNSMEIVACDGQAQVRMFCPCKGDDGAMCIPAKLLLDTINLFRENEVLITKKDDIKITLKNGKSKYNLTADTHPDEFSLIPVKGSGDEFLILQQHLAMGLKYGNKFISDESFTRGAEGINLSEIDNEMVFTGLDSFSMCRVNVKPRSIGAWSKNVVIPQDTAAKVLSLLDDLGEALICVVGDKIIFSGDTPDKFEVVSTSVNTKFPNSERIFNLRGEDFMTINNMELRDAVSRLRLYCSKLDKAKKVTIQTNTANKNELVLTAIDQDFQRAGEEVITINNNSGKALTKVFNTEYLLKILHSIDTTDILFYFKNTDKEPCFIVPVEENMDNDNFNFLISSCSI